MSKKQFNPKIFTKDRVMSSVQKGISKLWQWDITINEYKPIYFEARKKGTVRREDKATFQTLAEAKAWLYGSFTEEKKMSGPLFDEIFEKWKREHLVTLRRGSQIHYENKFHALSPLMNKVMSQINSTFLDEWVMWLKTLPVRTTRLDFKKEIKFLKVILQFYKEHSDEPYEIPIKKRHYQKSFIKEATMKPKPITETEFCLFVNELRKGSNGLMWAALATFQFYHALRIGEAVGIRKMDLRFGENPSDNIYTVNGSVKWYREINSTPVYEFNFKNSKHIGLKSSVLHPQAKQLLEELHNSSELQQHLFILNERLLTYRQIQNRFNTALTQAGLPHSSTHFLRKGGSSALYNNGGNSALVQQQLGVMSLEVADKYAKPSDSKLNEYYIALYEQNEI